MPWKIANWLARNWGWYTYDGLRGFQPRHWPVGHVLYKDGMCSVAMPLGNAWGYARSFGGTVIEAATVNSKPIHDSDCATHNEPAMPNGPCDCSLSGKKR